LSFEFARTLQLGPDYVQKPVPVSSEEDHPLATSRYLDSLTEGFKAHPYEYPNGDIAEEIDFLPLDTLKPVTLRKLPDELISHVLLESLLPPRVDAFPKVGTVEGFALVCRKGRSTLPDKSASHAFAARLLTLSESNLFRTACRLVYRPPYQIAPPSKLEDELTWEDDLSTEVCDSLCERLYQNDWRRFWLEQPRLRTDGCFISVVQYIRRGEAETAWVAPSQIVVYYRFVRNLQLAPDSAYSLQLRFLPNGLCISLVTTLSPSEIARSIDTNLRMKGMHIGRWQLRGDQIQCWALEDATVEQPKYEIEASYRLKSSSRGKMCVSSVA
jgi:F-box protein 9